MENEIIMLAFDAAEKEIKKVNIFFYIWTFLVVTAFITLTCVLFGQRNNQLSVSEISFTKKEKNWQKITDNLPPKEQLKENYDQTLYFQSLRKENKSTINLQFLQSVGLLGSLTLIFLGVSIEIKQSLNRKTLFEFMLRMAKNPDSKPHCLPPDSRPGLWLVFFGALILSGMMISFYQNGDASACQKKVQECLIEKEVVQIKR